MIKKSIRRRKEKNWVLAELLAGIFILGILEEALLLFFMKDKVSGSISLFAGVFTAAGMALHMAYTLDKALSADRGESEKQIQKYSVLRYFAVVVILGTVMISKIGNPLIVFLGIMNLKVAAYLQPFTHRIFLKIYKEEEQSS